MAFTSFLRTRSLHLLAVAVAFVAIAAAAGQTFAQALPAFSGAEGAGSTATGGRGYEVYHVTTLAESGPGSLRDAINARDADGNLLSNNRIVVFDVGGTIRFTPASQSDQWFRTGCSNITIAGQTAPGDGIFIYGIGTKFTGNNVVVRNLTFRPGTWAADPVNRTMDALWLQTTNSVIDHCSAEWHTDEGITTSDVAENTTVQHCLIAEGLNYASHSYGGMIQVDISNTTISYHHNLYVDNKSRNPRLGNKTNAVNTTDFRNNVMYNWQSNCGYSGSGEEGDGNFINNYYIAGPSTSSGDRTEAFWGDSALTGLYQSGNKIDPDRDGTFDGTDTGWGMFTGTYNPLSGSLAAPTVYTQSTDDALTTVLNYAGANWWNRNATDTRIVNQVRSAGTTGAIISYAEQVGGFPYYTEVHRPAGFDTDQDGMPNTWEIAHGLDPSAASNNGDYDADGYTNIEEYLNELAAFPAPKPIIWTGGTAGRYELITNWDIPWQPSRLDRAEINSGKATVAYIAQEAGTLYVGNTASSSGELAVTAGSLALANRLILGNATNATGTATLTGGSLTAGGAIVLASASSSTGVLTVSKDAVVEAAGLTINTGSGRSSIVGVQLDAGGNRTLIRTTGTSTLAGAMDVQVLSAYRPKEGDAFVVIASTDPNDVHFTGNFAQFTSNITYGLPPASSAFGGAASADEYAVVFLGYTHGDANGDHSVDGGDLSLMGGNWMVSTTGWGNCDFNNDGLVDGGDLALMGGNWNWTLPGGAPSLPIPEPVSLLLLSAAAPLALIRKRRP